MGVPKFFRWLSERYPKINQRHGCLPNADTCTQHFPERTAGPPQPLEPPDPMATCGLPPPIDRLYLDMNGIIHGCSHNNDEDETENGNGGTKSGRSRNRRRNPNDSDYDTDASIEAGTSQSTNGPSREEIFRNVCYYLDRVVNDIVQPEQLLYLAIDGVAPRAKLNQQRSRRYRSGGAEGEIETTIYEAHQASLMEEQARDEEERLMAEAEERNYGGSTNHKYDGSYSFVLDADEGNVLVSSEDEESHWSTENDTTQQQQHPHQHNEGDLQEVSRGRFKGKFEAQAGSKGGSSYSKPSTTTETPATVPPFHSNEITPGTPFFAEFTKHLEHFVKHKLSTDPRWQKLTVVFSGPNVPGEGEHKIMQFLREQRSTPDYDPNLRHCIMGQDGDLMMLGLLTHEPNLVLLREKVVFNSTSQKLEKAHAAEQARKNHNTTTTTTTNASLDAYLFNPHFEFLHLQVLRDYLAYEFETRNVLSTSPWDLERTIDDFVFMTFLIGNDFLPHLPALDIADQAFDLLYYTYKQCRKDWLEQDPQNPYLTHAGNIVSGSRLEGFLASVGSHEVTYYEKKKQTLEAENRRLRKQYRRLNMKLDALPDDSVVASKEEADRARYRSMLELLEHHDEEPHARDGTSKSSDAGAEASFQPVTTKKVEFQPAEDRLEEGLIRRMGTLLQNSLSGSSSRGSGGGGGAGAIHGDGDDDGGRLQLSEFDDQDLKGRYYFDKFNFTPFDADKHRALRKSYMEGLVWNLKYYYEGCPSWDWYYPYHYGPMLSDLVGLDELLDEISFENEDSKPLDPFDQLMGCMPPSQAHHLPEPYRPLMTDPESPIVDFYPNSFVVDMNGKRWPWEAVTLLPFIDSDRLIAATGTIETSQLSPEELARNTTQTAVVLKHDANHHESVPAVGTSRFFRTIDTCQAVSVPFDETDLKYTQTGAKPVFLPEVKPGTQYPLPGFATLRDAPVETLYRRRLGINVHGGKSRYKTASLEISGVMPPLPPVERLAPRLVGTTVFVNYPYFVEALVTAVSDEHTTIRGKNEPRKWTAEESNLWKLRRDGVVRRAEVGEGYCGTGGLIVPDDQPITLSVRPFQGFVTTTSGQKAKTFAVFEMEVPLIATFWAPSRPDTRLTGIPSRLEKNAYEIAEHETLGNTNPLLAGLANHSKSGKKKKTKRRKLFPPKKSSKSSKRNASFGGDELRAGGRSKLAAANFSSLAPGIQNGAYNRRNYSSLSIHFPKDRCHYFTPNVIFPQPFGTSLPQGWDLSGNFATSAPKAFHSSETLPQLLQLRTNNQSNPNSNAYRLPKRGSNPVKVATRSKHCGRNLGFRGRIFAAGLAVAACFANPTTATQNIPSISLPFWGRCTTTLRDPNHSGLQYASLEPWFLPRGGDFGGEENLVDNILPPHRLTPPLEFAHGTTTLSFAFQGGIIAAVDSRASMGQFVGSKTTQKVLPVSSHILGTMAGGAADCQHWIRKLKAKALLHELTEDGRRMSVARASRTLSNYMYALRGLDLSVGTMIMGYDDIASENGEPPPHIYYVDNTGLRIQGDMFAVGSGSTFALGILDSEKDRYNLSVDEAISLGIKAIRHATFRDAYSGGYINVYLITPKDGWKKVYTEDIARNPEVWKARN